MLDVYKLSQAINESATGCVDVPAYNFIGSMDEATSEFNFVLMSEQANLLSFKTSAEEIMTEAAISNPSAMEALSENIFETIGKKVKAILDKIIAMVKGIIDKLKAFFYKFTGKTSKWLSVMKPRINAAAGISGANDMDVEAHKWDVAYITDGMVSGINDIMMYAGKDADGKFSEVSALEGVISGTKANLSPDMQGKNGDDESVKKAVAALDKIVEEQKVTDEQKQAAVSAVAEAMDVSGSDSSIDDVWSAVTKKATGGEKVTMKVSECAGGKFGSGVDGMLKAIEESKKTISSLQKVYDNHLKTLKSLRSKADSAFKSESKVDKLDKYPTELKGKYQNALNAITTQFTTALTFLEGAVNTARGKNTSYLQTMTSEYMSVLSKFAGYKKKKEA